MVYLSRKEHDHLGGRDHDPVLVGTGEVALPLHHSVVVPHRVVQLDSGEQLPVLELGVHHAHVPDHSGLVLVRHAVSQPELHLAAAREGRHPPVGAAACQLLGRQLAGGAGAAVVSEVLEGWDAG